MLILLFSLLILAELVNGIADKIIPEDYDFIFMPNHEEEAPLEVTFYVKINGIQEINLDEMTIKMNMLLQVSWTDERLMFPENALNYTDNQTLSLRMTGQFLDRIWKPDHSFRFVHSVKKFKVLQNFIDVKLMSTKKIVTTSMYIAVFECPMNFIYYPFDTQICHFYIGSYFYTTKDLIFTWDELGLEIDKAVDLQMDDYDYSLIKYNETICNFAKYFPSDNIPCIQLVLTMKRYYWVQILWYFIPSSIIVMVTWLSFWWPAEIVNGRTILTIRSLVMISGIYSAARKKSPKTGYPDALDTWMTFIIFTGVFPLYQYAVVLQCLSFKKAVMKSKVHPEKSAYDIRLKDILRFEKYQRRAELVGRIGYPVAFFVFNLCFWVFYTWQ